MAKINYIIIFMMFFFLAALRYNIGGDTQHYMSNWHMYPSILSSDWADEYQKIYEHHRWAQRYQPGWMFYAMIVKSIHPSFITLQVITSFLLNFAIFRTIRKYSPYPFLSLLIYYLTFTFILLEFEVVRESIAVSIFLLVAFDNWVQKKWLRYYIGTSLAFLIHPSAILMFIFPIFRHIEWKTKTYAFVLILPVLLLAIGGRLILAHFISNSISSDSFMSFYADRALDVSFNNNYIYPRLLDPGIFMAIIYLWRRYCLPIFIPMIVFTIIILILVLYDFDMIRMANYIIIPSYIGITPVLMHLIKRFHTVWIAVLLVTVYNIPQMMVQYDTSKKRSRYFPYQNVIFPKQTAEQKKYLNGNPF